MKCNVCNHEFEPKKESRYVAIERGAMFSPNKYFDCFDCPVCGCQIVAQERFDTVADCVEVEQGDIE